MVVRIRKQHATLDELRDRRRGAMGVFTLTIFVGALAMGGCASSTNSHQSAASTMSSPPASQPFGDSVAAGPTVMFHGLRISGGYVPQPASPSVAAAYLAIDNTTDQPERLVKVITNVTKSVMAMNETDHGTVGSMTDLSTVTVAAHSTYRFVPDHAHLMLQNPTHLIAGDRVVMTMTFAPAGMTTVLLPVIPIGQTPVQAPASFSSSTPAGSSTPGMPGMTMSTPG